VKGIMLQNVEQVLVRGERLDVLVDRTDDLRDQVRGPAGHVLPHVWHMAEGRWHGVLFC
jgi:hypothetical protein